MSKWHQSLLVLTMVSHGKLWTGQAELEVGRERMREPWDMRGRRDGSHNETWHASVET
jgi:hypothetical protein